MVTGFGIKEIDTTVQVGVDRKGVPLFDGDRVLSFNLMEGGETWPLSEPKRGVPAVIRRGDRGLFVVSDAGELTGCVPHDETYGVEKIG